MIRNDFERLCSLYLRLNGFFHIANFTVHYTPKSKKAEEIDFVGVRFPNSSEKPLKEDGNYDDIHPFEDDEKILCMIDKSKVTILLGEATVSLNSQAISRRIEKLKNTLRIKYVLQRFGIFDREEIERIINGKSNRFYLLRIMFVLSKKNVRIKDVENIKFLSYRDLYSFIEDRAKHISKVSSIHLLPQGLQDFVAFLQSLKLKD